MNADTISASPASCRSTSHRLSSTYGSVSAYAIVSAKVRPISRKNGSTGSEPGAAICAYTADPSRMVLRPARTKISRATVRRSVVSTALGQLADQVEDRHVHRDDDAADDAAENRDHDRLEQRQQAGDRRIDFLF